MPAIGNNPISKDFVGAVKYCNEEFKGHLVNPNNYKKQQLLDASHGFDVWMGIYKSTAITKNFFPIDMNKGFEEIVYSPEYSYDVGWARGQPDNFKGAEYCGELYGDGRLNDNDCTRNRFFLCEGTYHGTRSGASHSIVDAETAAIVRENIKFENQQIRFNDFLDDAIRETYGMSKIHALRLRNLQDKTISKIEFTDRQLCDDSPYAERKYQNEFYIWHLARNISEHENVCDIFRDVHDGIVHFIHAFGCSGDFKAVNRKFTNLLTHFCPDLAVVRKRLGINFTRS